MEEEVTQFTEEQKKAVDDRSLEYVAEMGDLINEMFAQNQLEGGWREDYERSSVIKALTIVTISAIMSAPFPKDLKRKAYRTIIDDLKSASDIIDQMEDRDQ